jgi:acyl transferase domain-containing protein
MDSPFQETLLAVGSPDLQYGTGGSSSVVAGRLSHFFKLRGPSMTVDTACSSSLVAIDAAARAIRSGQCAKAIVCAAHAVLTPTSSVFLSKARMISPNGRCATFDADADGYCRSEGYGAVVLERLRDAEASERPVWGVLCGSAVNHNGGTSNGITAPSTLAQREVLAAALADAGHLDPARVSLIEAHGTGTPVGDPIEMAALVDVYGKPRWRAQQRANGGQLAALAVASVKTNIGHAEPSRYVPYIPTFFSIGR